MPSGLPTSAYCRWPPDGPDLLLNAAIIGFELAQPLFKMATGAFLRCCRFPSDGPPFLQSGSTNNLSWPSPLQTGCCRWYGVGRWQDDADGPLMAHSFYKAVTDGIGLACHQLLPIIRWPAALQSGRPIASSWPCSSQTVCCQWYGVGQSPDTADGLLMAQNYFTTVIPIASRRPTTRCCR